ncbi:helix-turn-helix domain-containing protein [Corynebacterium propinquum]|uniref:helix-turn-helix domain-containing protein n=1 Tax=Corynebacterium propinquum TaxID=43769 RepID=UPI00254D5FCA|nr:helix-turn-helix transcriptional regulator [Corynebacterium propinquum]MDK8535823.1 helix-turn-helix transcriptional regulator [Corynebacterium propinquum]
MSVVNIEIGQRIVDARKVVGVSQRELANETGLSQPTIQRIEKGERAASRLELVLIADGCGVLVDDLLGTNSIADEVRCAGRTDEDGSKALADYLIYAFGVSRRLDQLGIPELV